MRQGELQVIKSIDELTKWGPTEHVASMKAIRDFAKLSIATGAATVYEGGIQSSMKMSGLQKRKYMASLATEWTAFVGKDIIASAHVHAALFAMVQSQPRPAASSAVGAA